MSNGLELSRVTLVAPRRRIDLSLPSDIPLAHLLPTLLRAAGEDLANAGLAHSGWALQRLDDAPFDLGQTLEQLGVLDGEMLYFRPRIAQLPELNYDDVADVVATGINERTDRWRGQSTRAFGLGVAGAALGLGALALLFTGPPWIAPAVVAVVAALLLLVGAVAFSRAYGDSGAGMVFGFAAIPYGFIAGLLAPAKHSQQLLHLGSPHLLAAFAGAFLVAMVAGFSVADGLPVFLGVIIASGVGVICAGADFTWPGMPAAGVGGTAAAVLVALSGLIPTLALRMARVPLPAVPNSADDLRKDTMTIDGKALLKQTGTADRYVSGLLAAIALTTVGASIFLVTNGSWTGKATATAFVVVLLLRSRVFRGRAQKAWLLIGGFAVLGCLAVAAVFQDSGQTTTLAGVVVPLVIGAAVVAGVSTWLPSHRPSPFWGRVGDIIDLLAVISLIPLALAALNVYSKIRGLAS